MDFNKEKDYIWAKLSELQQRIDKDSNAIERLLKELSTESEKDAEQASRKTSFYRNRARDAKEQAEQEKESILTIRSELESLLESVKKRSASADVFGQQIQSACDSSHQKADEISNLIDDVSDYIETVRNIAETHETLVSDIEAIKNIRIDGESNSVKIKGILSSCLAFKREINEAYEEIYGYVDEGTEGVSDTKVEGLIDQLNKSYKEIRTELITFASDLSEKKEETDRLLIDLKSKAKDDFKAYIENCKKEHSDVLLSIHRLLPRAMTAGLASAYNEKIDEELKDQTKHERSFGRSINFLVLISLIPFCINAYRLLFGGDELVLIIKDTPYLLSAMLPLYIPVFWLAYTTNKNYKLSKRLIEEYTHKGVVSKTFEGLAHQIDQIEDKDISEELRVKLLFNIVSINTENPGKLISNYDKSDHPLMDALDKSVQLADAVTKLSKIPGFSTLAKKLADKESQLRAINADKVDAVLETEHAEISSKNTLA